MSDEEFMKGVVTDPAVFAPRVIRSVDSEYTSDAMRAKIQGSVRIEIVVLPNGTVDFIGVSGDVIPGIF